MERGKKKDPRGRKEVDQVSSIQQKKRQYYTMSVEKPDNILQPVPKMGLEVGYHRTEHKDKWAFERSSTKLVPIMR